MNGLGNKEIMAKNIRYYMERAGVTQTEICNTLGIKMPTFSDWIHAKTYPRIDKIELMANYFGILKSDLVEERTVKSEVTEKKAALVAKITKDSELLSTVEEYYSLSEAMKQFIRNMVHDLTERDKED